MKEETLFEVIWEVMGTIPFKTPQLMRLVEYQEPNVDNYNNLVKEGPFEVHLFKADLSTDPFSILQSMIICNQ